MKPQFYYRLSLFVFSLFLSALFQCSYVLAGENFLSNWMGELEPVLGEQTLLDLSLPGTHNSLSYDLSTIISYAADDESNRLSEVLHLASELHLTPGGWIRNESKTQNLSITDQLNNGIRFIDFRTMYTTTLLTSPDWYSVHFVQSNKRSVEYLQEIRDWLDAHPKEVVVLLISKHGGKCSVGTDQFPGVSIDAKRKFWGKIESIFDGLLLNAEQSPLGETSLKKLIESNQRAVIFASDYAEFTGNSPHALDACPIEDRSFSGITDEENAYLDLLNLFRDANHFLDRNKRQNKFLLTSLASSGSREYLKYAYLGQHLPIIGKKYARKCASSFQIPLMTDWCPPELLDISRLTNYYNQINLDLAIQCNLGYPNAIYLDAVDEDGTILTGALSRSSNDPGNTKYAYVDSLLYMDVNRACQNSPKTSECENALLYLSGRRQKYPLRLWNDPAHGRLENWPVEKVSGSFVCPSQ